MRAILAAPLALACGMALAQPPTIYRCGESYGTQPCAGGKEIPPDGAWPTDAERREAASAARRDARLAESLEKERLKQEARPAGAYIPPPAPEAFEPRKSPEKAATRKLDLFTASGPVPDKGRKEKRGTGGKKAGKSGHGAKEEKKPSGRLAGPDSR